MKPESHASLKSYNTFGLECTARALLRILKKEDLNDLSEFLNQNEQLSLVLGGGSNMLLPNYIDRIVLKNELHGIGIVEEDAYEAIVYAAGGVSWHEMVCFALDHNLGGIENLSLIPGTVGAAPIQNIGAYGVELKDTFHHLEAWSLQHGGMTLFTTEDCDFGYRDSVFKKQEAGKWLITGVYLKLSKHPELKLSYGAIQEELAKRNITHPDIRAVSEAVISIRRSKLPDPAILGNAGSFFKNPEIPEPQYEALKEVYPGLVAYPQPNGKVKLAAGWMIEACGWKGHDRGGYGVHDKQALVLVNRGGGTGDKLIALAKEIIVSVYDTFGIQLIPEVHVFENDNPVSNQNL